MPPVTIADRSTDYASRAIESRLFLQTLFPPGASGYVEIRAKRGPFISQRWYTPDNLPRLPRMLEKLNDYNVWVGAALRAQAGSGGRANCSRLFSVHVDSDCKDRAAAAAFVARVKAFPLAPSMIVQTGGPWRHHLYWKLAEPLSLRDAAGAVCANVEEQYRRIIVGLAQHFGGDPSVSDLPRVMRLPGSRNIKPGNGGVLVRLLQCHPERQYPLAAFDPWRAPEKPPAPPRALRVPHDQDDSDAVDFGEEFSRRGWLLEDQGGGMFYVRCPWADQHSGDSGASATAIWAPASAADAWGFCCLHAHCRGRRAAQVYEWVRLMRLAEGMLA